MTSKSKVSLIGMLPDAYLCDVLQLDKQAVNYSLLTQVLLSNCGKPAARWMFYTHSPT